MTLQEAIAADDVDELYSLIKGNENLLDHGHKGPFPNTPLHNAANKGRIKVAMEIAILKPLFARKLNQEGFNPMHLALHQKHYHIVLLGWLKRARLTQILNWKDQDGNTILHIAAFERQSEIIDLLLGYMDVNEKNFQGHTALEIFELNPSGSPDIANRFRSAGRPKRLSVSEKCANLCRIPDESARNAILVVSTLIAAATYQAALSPPGGYWQDSSSNPPANSTAIAANSSSIALEKPHQAGEIILSGSKLFLYETCNSLAFFTSILTIWVTTFTVEANPMFFSALPFLCGAFGMSSLIQIPKNNEAAGYPLFALYVFLMIAGFCLPMGVNRCTNKFSRYGSDFRQSIERKIRSK
ncbi:hypothetical protein EUGRSUZ_D00951 [Eucalyptus grandis]|uniref:PGG domain-containing protein n=1 Tax=Eucalyptus grandis TaxID=71139 RepID=A0A059CEI1_EUCGR|nr:hypothetical protein EUGRSUZ_D00951 [Eucalyptus grandis]